MPLWILIVLSAVELALLALLLAFFLRLRRSEALLNQLQQNQDNLLSKLRFNAELEQELVSSFQERQDELARLSVQLDERAQELRGLLDRADKVTKSPDTLRQIVLNGHSRGQSARALAHSTGLSVDEVELILMEAKAS
jgi:biopolymer transport protein ExbB/TolQ